MKMIKARSFVVENAFFFYPFVQGCQIFGIFGGHVFYDRLPNSACQTKYTKTAKLWLIRGFKLTLLLYLAIHKTFLALGIRFEIIFLNKSTLKTSCRLDSSVARYCLYVLKWFQ